MDQEEKKRRKVLAKKHEKRLEKLDKMGSIHVEDSSDRALRLRKTKLEEPEDDVKKEEKKEVGVMKESTERSGTVGGGTVVSNMNGADPMIDPELAEAIRLSQLQYEADFRKNVKKKTEGKREKEVVQPVKKEKVDEKEVTEPVEKKVKRRKRLGRGIGAGSVSRHMRNEKKAKRKMNKQLTNFRELQREKWKQRKLSGGGDSNQKKTKKSVFDIFKKKKKKVVEVKKKPVEEEKEPLIEKIEAKGDSKPKDNIHRIDSTFMSEESIGKECLKLTNEYRAKYSLEPFVWDHRIFEIAMVHSKNIGQGQAKFDHGGFDKRLLAMQKFSDLVISGGGENLGVVTTNSTVAKDAVDGWINSPGHRKNLVGSYHYCAISPFKAPNGLTYLTQLFGKRSGLAACSIQ